MKTCALKLSVIAAALGVAFAPTELAATTLYFNDTPNNQMATASRPDAGGKTEIESADDFVLTAGSSITSGTFTGLIVGTGVTVPTISAVGIEIYRVFPLDSNSPPSTTVPTRANSPSDVALATRDSAGSTLSFGTSTLSTTFTALNSVLTGINPVPGQRTGGDGPITGTEVQFTFTLNSAINLAADHYFFIPQVQVAGGEFYWLSASRPISGAGTTPFPAGSTDLQSWIRNENLDPNWLRVGTDIVGGTTPPTFNAAFSLNGTVASAPDTGTTGVLLCIALGSLAFLQRADKRRSQAPG